MSAHPLVGVAGNAIQVRPTAPCPDRRLPTNGSGLPAPEHHDDRDDNRREQARDGSGHGGANAP
ncbi:hypothetical protein [Kitasatospora sp. NPDC087314]|uniref:hypothetical protein n=1 Tax=Kitasatospora sp. NPDC087314 TaxID=3364068 RepID=UPI0038157226